MHVEYINKNGYIVETKRAVYVFDYVDGRLPAAYLRNSKPLLFFVSNKDDAHYSQSVFSYSKTVVLSYDVDVIPYSKVFKMKHDDMLHLGFAKVFAIQVPSGGLSYIIKEVDTTLLYASHLSLYALDDGNKLTPAYEKELFFNAVKLIKAYEPFDIAILEVNSDLGDRHVDGLEYILDRIEVGHVFPTNFNELDPFIAWHQTNNKFKFYQPKFTNHQFEVKNV